MPISNHIKTSTMSFFHNQNKTLSNNSRQQPQQFSIFYNQNNMTQYFLLPTTKKKKKWSIFHLQNNYDTMLTLTIKKTANFQSFPYVIQQFYPLSATKAANFQSSTIKTTTSKQAKKQTKKQKKSYPSRAAAPDVLIPHLPALRRVQEADRSHLRLLLKAGVERIARLHNKLSTPPNIEKKNARKSKRKERWMRRVGYLVAGGSNAGEDVEQTASKVGEPPAVMAGDVELLKVFDETPQRKLDFAFCRAWRRRKLHMGRDLGPFIFLGLL